jgi:hypothetical protein
MKGREVLDLNMDGRIILKRGVKEIMNIVVEQIKLAQYRL